MAQAAPAAAPEPNPDRPRFGLDDRVPAAVLLLGALQWLLVTLPITILVPLVLAHLGGLTPGQTAGFIEASLLVTGVASLAQVLWGHRLPLTEGQAGLWWGVTIALLGSVAAFGQSGLWMLRNLEGGVALAGVLVCALGLLRLARRVRVWFGPAVTGTFLVLLAVQISGTLVGGILGVGSGRPLQPPVAVTALAVTAFVVALSLIGPGLVRTFAVLIGLALGWLAFWALGLAPPVGALGGAPLPLLALPRPLPWGPPAFDPGVAIVCAITGLVNLGNVMGALISFEHVLGERLPPRLYDRTTAWTGLAHVLAGGAGVIGTSPFASAAGVVALSGLATRLPFTLGSILVVLLGLLPRVGAFFATLPVPVGDAVLLVAFVQMLGFGLNDLGRLRLTQQSIYRVGVPILVGTGLFVLPPATFTSLPAAVRFVCANGTIVGTVLALALDRWIRWPGGLGETAKE